MKLPVTQRCIELQAIDVLDAQGGLKEERAEMGNVIVYDPVCNRFEVYSEKVFNELFIETI